MKQLRLVNTVNIGDYFACPIAYGTDSYENLTDLEIKQLTEFLTENAQYEIEVSDNYNEFAKCTLTGFMGACVEINTYEWIES